MLVTMFMHDMFGVGGRIQVHITRRRMILSCCPIGGKLDVPWWNVTQRLSGKAWPMWHNIIHLLWIDMHRKSERPIDDGFYPNFHRRHPIGDCWILHLPPNWNNFVTIIAWPSSHLESRGLSLLCLRRLQRLPPSMRTLATNRPYHWLR